jgi:hypothetical protein
MSKEIVYWKQRNGTFIDIDSMDVSHLRNVLKMIVKNSNKHKDKIEKETYWKKQNEKVFLNGDMANEFNDTMEFYEYDEEEF